MNDLITQLIRLLSTTELSPDNRSTTEVILTTLLDARDSIEALNAKCAKLIEYARATAHYVQHTCNVPPIDIAASMQLCARCSIEALCQS